MFLNAQRAGVPLDPVAIAKNLAERGLPQQINDHKVDLGRKRKFLATDCLHHSVMLVDGIPGRPHNNPTSALRRADDEGRFA